MLELYSFLEISIHIPTKGMTFTSPRILYCLSNFNSHPHKGDDTIRKVLHQCRLRFQFTSPQRGWLYWHNGNESDIIFQFTSPQRGWRRIIQSCFHSKIFQFTSPQRGWPIVAQDSLTAIQFQFTSPQRGWHHLTGKYPRMSIFQFTSPQRGWPLPHWDCRQP